jgi:hypothetical protein
MTINNPAVLSAGDAARALGIAPSTLAKLRLSGNGPIYCKLGRRVVYRREDLAAWLESHVARNRRRSEAATQAHRGVLNRCVNSNSTTSAPFAAEATRKNWCSAKN